MKPMKTIVAFTLLFLCSCLPHYSPPLRASASVGTQSRVEVSADMVHATTKREPRWGAALSLGRQSGLGSTAGLSLSYAIARGDAHGQAAPTSAAVDPYGVPREGLAPQRPKTKSVPYPWITLGLTVDLPQPWAGWRGDWQARASLTSGIVTSRAQGRYGQDCHVHGSTYGLSGIGVETFAGLQRVGERTAFVGGLGILALVPGVSGYVSLRNQCTD